MTLEEAIIHAEAVAKAKEREAKENRNHGGWAYDDEAKKCSACAAEHRQLAEWLKELKERREKDVSDINVGDMVSRQKAIDAINNIMPTKEGFYEPSEVLCKLMQLPSAQPEPCEDVVSRKTAIEAVMDLCKHYTPTKSVKHPHVDFVIEALQNLPSAQPEIIRCKDCKWWSNDDYRECSNPNYGDGYVTPAGFYCGYAERRTDERTD